MKIGDRIKEKREEKNMSQVKLANNIKVSKQTLYKYENNIVTNIPSDKIELLAKFLDTTPAYLMGWEEPLPDYDAFNQVLSDTIWSYKVYSHCEESHDCPLTDDEKLSLLCDGISYDVCDTCPYNGCYYYLTDGDKYYKFEEKEFDDLTSCLKPYLLFRISEAISKKKSLTEYEYQMQEGLIIPEEEFDEDNK